MNRGTGLGFAGGLAVAVLFALALRLFFVLTPHAALDADEAIVGLMGRHVLRGEFPIFYYGQTYMGGLEPHLAALGFAIGGATPLVLKLVCLAVALVLVGLTAELGRRILGPGPGLVAGVFMALPPIFLTVCPGRVHRDPRPGLAGAPSRAPHGRDGRDGVACGPL